MPRVKFRRRFRHFHSEIVKRALLRFHLHLFVGEGGELRLCATTIESGLFKIQAKHLLQFRQRRQAHQKRQEIIDGVYRNALATEEDMQQDDEIGSDTLRPDPPSTEEPADQAEDLTRSFVRLTNLPTYPLDRLSRYEATLWHQARQVLFTLQCLDRRKPWERRRLR